MRYRDIAAEVPDRFRLPSTHPVLAQIEIDPVDRHRFEQLSEDNPDVEIVGHDAITGGRVTMFVACVDEGIQQKLLDGWA